MPAQNASPDLERAVAYYTRGKLSRRDAARAAGVSEHRLRGALRRRGLARSYDQAARLAYRERGHRGAAYRERGDEIGRLYFGHPYASIADAARAAGAGYAPAWKHVRAYAERMGIPFATPAARRAEARRHVGTLTRLGFTHRQIAARLGFTPTKVLADRRALREQGGYTDALLAPAARRSLARALALLGHADAEHVAALPAIR